MPFNFSALTLIGAEIPIWWLWRRERGIDECCLSWKRVTDAVWI